MFDGKIIAVIVNNEGRGSLQAYFRQELDDRFLTCTNEREQGSCQEKQKNAPSL
jgi:hypothetical protein